MSKEKAATPKEDVDDTEMSSEEIRERQKMLCKHFDMGNLKTMSTLVPNRVKQPR